MIQTYVLLSLSLWLPILQSTNRPTASILLFPTNWLASTSRIGLLLHVVRLTTQSLCLASATRDFYPFSSSSSSLLELHLIRFHMVSLPMPIHPQSSFRLHLGSNAVFNLLSVAPWQTFLQLRFHRILLPHLCSYQRDSRFLQQHQRIHQ